MRNWTKLRCLLAPKKSSPNNRHRKTYPTKLVTKFQAEVHPELYNKYSIGTLKLIQMKGKINNTRFSKTKPSNPIQMMKACVSRTKLHLRTISLESKLVKELMQLLELVCTSLLTRKLRWKFTKNISFSIQTEENQLRERSNLWRRWNIKALSGFMKLSIRPNMSYSLWSMSEEVAFMVTSNQSLTEDLKS